MSDDRLFMVLDSNVCPTCDEPLTLTEINGVKSFVEEHNPKEESGLYPPENEVTSNVWEKGITEQGEFVYRCDKGHVYVAFLTFGGDWTL